MQIASMPGSAESKPQVSGTGIASETNGPAVVEHESFAAAASYTKKKKNSILPWILAGAGVAAFAVVLLFVVFKSNKEELREEFDSVVSTKWLPRHESYWNVAGGFYSCSALKASKSYWEYSIYDKAWSKPNYTVTIKMRRSSDFHGFGINLTTTNDPSATHGYQLYFLGDTRFLIKAMNGSDMTALDNKYTVIQDWLSNNAILTPVSAWNVFKIIKAGTNYSIYANDTLLVSFDNETYDPRYVGLFAYANTLNVAPKMDLDYVYVEMN